MILFPHSIYNFMSVFSHSIYNFVSVFSHIIYNFMSVFPHSIYNFMSVFSHFIYNFMSVFPNSIRYFMNVSSCKQFKGMIQINLPIPPFRVRVLQIFIPSGASLQVVSYIIPCKKRFILPYHRPLEQKCRNPCRLCGCQAGSGRTVKPPSWQRNFDFYSGRRKIRLYFSVW